MKIIKVDENYSGKRLDRFLIAYFKNCSKNFIYKLLRLKKIKINGKKEDEKYILKKDDLIQIYVSDEQYQTMLSSSQEEETKKIKDKNIDESSYPYFLSILYEDESVLIVQKPTDMVVLEDQKEKEYVLQNFVRRYLIAKDSDEKYYDSNSEKAKFLPSAVHRIDRNTAGLVMFAKKYQSFVDLTELIKKREIEKEYLAIVYGQLLLPKKVTIHIKKNEKENLVFVNENFKDEETKIAITDITPLIITKEATLVRAKIETGRTHQIRVTMANSGHPIINDFKYGEKRLYSQFTKKYNINSMLLLAYSLKFSSNLAQSIKNLSNLRVKAVLPLIWKEILQKHFNISEGKLEELIESLRK